VLNLSINHGRWLLDETYYLLIIVMLLNIIFGIIIDTFSSLRLQKLARMEDTVGVCFICGIEKQIFDRASDEPDGFKKHVKLDHNMWNYLYFIFLLWEQDKDDDDGMEQYVRRALEADEISWFPLNKAICLDHSATDEELILAEINNKMKLLESSLAQRITNFEVEVNSIMEQISAATKIEYKSGEVKTGIADFLIAQQALQKQMHDGTETVAESILPKGLNESGDDGDDEDASFVEVDDMADAVEEDGFQSVVIMDAMMTDLMTSEMDSRTYLDSDTGEGLGAVEDRDSSEVSMSEEEVLRVHNIESEEDEYLGNEYLLPFQIA
jgi:hypothetical protein